MTNAQSRPLRDACIYIILSPNHNLCYYGSTFDTLNNRFTQHKAPSSTCTSKEIIDAGNAKIFELAYYPCHTKEQLEDREAHYIITDWDGCINDRVPGAVRRAGGQVAYASTPKQKEYRYEKIACNICGCMIMRKNMSEHQKTNKCQNFIQTEQLDQ